MTISLLKQEKYEITKIDWRIDSYKIYGQYMAAELPSVLIPLKNTYELKY